MSHSNDSAAIPPLKISDISEISETYKKAETYRVKNRNQEHSLTNTMVLEAFTSKTERGTASVAIHPDPPRHAPDRYVHLVMHVSQRRRSLDTERALRAIEKKWVPPGPEPSALSLHHLTQLCTQSPRNVPTLLNPHEDRVEKGCGPSSILPASQTLRKMRFNQDPRQTNHATLPPLPLTNGMLGTNFQSVPLNEGQQSQEEVDLLNATKVISTSHVDTLFAPENDVMPLMSDRHPTFVPVREIQRRFRSQLRISEHRLRSCKFGGLIELPRDRFYAPDEAISVSTQKNIPNYGNSSRESARIQPTCPHQSLLHTSSMLDATPGRGEYNGGMPHESTSGDKGGCSRPEKHSDNSNQEEQEQEEEGIHAQLLLPKLIQNPSRDSSCVAIPSRKVSVSFDHPLPNPLSTEAKQHVFHLTDLTDENLETSRSNISAGTYSHIGVEEEFPTDVVTAKSLLKKLAEDLFEETQQRVNNDSTTKIGLPKLSLRNAGPNGKVFHETVRKQMNELHQRVVTSLDTSNDTRCEMFYIKELALSQELSKFRTREGMAPARAQNEILHSVRAYIATLNFEKALKKRTQRYARFFALMNRYLDQSMPHRGCPHSKSIVEALSRLARQHTFLLHPAQFVAYMGTLEHTTFLLFSVQKMLRFVAPVFGVSNARLDELLAEKIRKFDAHALNFHGEENDGKIQIQLLRCRGPLVRENVPVRSERSHSLHPTVTNKKASVGSELVQNAEAAALAQKSRKHLLLYKIGKHKGPIYKPHSPCLGT